MSNNIKPSKYPVGPDEEAELFDQAVAAGRAGKQDTLVSGTNIKTINGASVLGSGDLTVTGSGASWGSITGTLSSQTDLSTELSGKQATLVSGSNIKTINGNSVLGSGNLTITGGSGPQVLGYSGTVGTTSSTSIVISKSLFIPANTLTSDSILELSWRINRVSGNVGQVYSRVYLNQTNSLTGASLISGIVTINSGTQALLAQKSISCIGTQLRYQNTSSGTESTASPLSTLSINTTFNYYLLFTAQCQNVADVGAIDQFKVLLYA